MTYFRPHLIWVAGLVRQSAPSEAIRRTLAALPPEGVLCAQYAVSRTVVREATMALIEKGLVESQQGRGTIVRSRDHWNLLDPLVLGALECRAAAPQQAVEATKDGPHGITPLRGVVDVVEA